jgi:hypothetical protein
MVADPVKVSTPVVEFQEPEIPLAFTNESTSFPVWKPLVMETVAL